MNDLTKFFSAYFRPLAVFGISFLLVTWSSVHVIRYGSFVSALQSSNVLSESSLEDVLAETDNLEDLLITFNYETVFVQPVEFQKDITAPNILYSLSAGDGISLSGDAQKPTIKNTGVLSVNGLSGEVTLEAGENVTFVEENGVLTIKSTDTNTDTDTKLSETEVEDFIFDGESTGEFSELQIGEILLSDAGTSATTSGSSLVGVYQGNLTTLSGTNVQQVIENIDSTLSSLSTSSHAAVTFAGSLDYLTLTGQQITLNQIDLATDVTGTLPSNQMTGAYSGITGVGTITSGTWQGSIINSTYLDSSVILSTEIDTSAEIAGIVGDETGSGALVFSNSPTFTGTLKLTDGSTAKFILDSLSSSTWGNVITSTNYAESTGVGFGIGGNSSMTSFPRFVLNADNSYVGWAMRPGDGGAPGSTNGEGNFMVRGNVGVGTSNPGALLDVQGAAQFGTGNVDLINTTGKIVAINSTYFASVDGSALTSLNASNLSSGTVASARISGSYTGITGLGTISTGTWQGTAINPTYLDTNVILSSEIDTYSELNSLVSDVTLTHNGLIDTSSEIATIVGDETGSGALVFGTSPNLTTPNIGAATGTSLSVSGAITTGGVVTGTGSGLSGLNASNLSSGTVPDARITGAYTGMTNLTGSGTATFGTFSGSGASLTSLNASNLSSGTVASARISGSYTGITGTGALNAGSISSGFGNVNIGTSTFTGNGSGLTTLNASNLSSGTVADARITGSYTGLTNLTGSGSSTFGSFLLSANGSVSAPAIRWSSDTNMGIYRVSSDQLGFATNGVIRMYLNSWGGLAVGDLDNFLLGPNVGNRLYVGGASSSDSANERLSNIEYINTRSDTGPFTQRALEVTASNSGSDAPGSYYYAIYGNASNLQTGTSGIHESYGVYGEAVGNTNGSGYAYGVYCKSTGADNNYCGGNQAWTQFSDRRIKKNITTIDGALDILMNLRGVRYQRTDDGSDKVHIGFIAQEVLPYLPEVVSYFGSEDRYTMSYADITALTVNAIQEQNKVILTNKSNIANADLQINETGEILSVVNSQTKQLLVDQNSILDQINIQKSVQDTNIASNSATLTTLQDRVQAIEQMTNDTDAVIAGLQDRISQLESIFGTQTATEVAALDGSTSDVLGVSDQLDLETLTVTGDTNLNTLGVTGDITAGLLSIKGFDDELATPSASISTISGPLKIQDQAAGDLEIMGGKVLINTDGNIVVQGSITVNKINIDETKEETKSTGDGKITSGENEVVIKTTAVTNSSRIFVTGKSIVKSPLTVVEKIAGESFTVHIAVPEEEDIRFDWLIVN